MAPNGVERRLKYGLRLRQCSCPRRHPRPKRRTTNVMDYVRKDKYCDFRVIWGESSDGLRQDSDKPPTSLRQDSDRFRILRQDSDKIPTRFRQVPTKIRGFAHVSLYLSHFDIKHTFDAIMYRLATLNLISTPFNTIRHHVIPSNADYQHSTPIGTI
jgi:hypothetical protein